MSGIKKQARTVQAVRYGYGFLEVGQGQEIVLGNVHVLIVSRDVLCLRTL